MLVPALLDPPLPLRTTPASFALRSGDRVVFFGDSITDYGAYPALIETFVATRYPGASVTFRNSGLGGDRASGIGLAPVDDRLTRDLIAPRPTVATIMLGMNDAEYRPFAPEPFAKYTNAYAHIADRLQKEAPNARVWLLRPTPYDDVTKPETFPGGYNAVLLRYADAVGELARARGFGLIDLNAPLVSLLKEAKASKPELAVNLIPDRIHPIPQTHLAIAAEILQAWCASPVVSTVRVNWATGRSGAENAVMSAPTRNATKLAFTLKEGSLPMPLDRKDAFAKLVTETIAFDTRLNRETLTVDAMPPGRYTLTVDGEPVGAFTDGEFAAGLNLAAFETPMMRQARTVADLTNRIVGLRSTRTRAIGGPLTKAPKKELDEVIRSMIRLEAAMTARRAELARPKTHRFEMVPL